MANIKLTYTVGNVPGIGQATETVNITDPQFALEIVEAIKAVRKSGIDGRLEEMEIDGVSGNYASTDHARRLRSAEARLKEQFGVDRSSVPDPTGALVHRLMGR